MCVVLCYVMCVCVCCVVCHVCICVCPACIVRYSASAIIQTSIIRTLAYPDNLEIPAPTPKDVARAGGSAYLCLKAFLCIQNNLIISLM